ncbi:uncharacterized protein LOC104420195 [Eucalyptus grandis]|uniref:uncharacterized protein LOC104420195 n=1 Tax=Eucalyptus grandis TaxID=71139 RepID=UPI00192EC7A6|nr:uncharacterized protein LOC104420195 [Eucalyptus grandis]
MVDSQRSCSGQPDQHVILTKLALRFFFSLWSTSSPLYCLARTRLEFDPLPFKGELYCNKLFRRSLLYPGSKLAAIQQLSQTRLQFLHYVTKLRKKWIKFGNNEVESFQNVQFKDETLEIPRLVILDTASNDITTYLFFMDNLIDSAKDVRHLHDYGIMRHGLRSDAEVTDFLNQICKEVVLVDSHSYLSNPSKDVDTYSSNKWNGWIAILELKYFNNSWSIISLIAAFNLLLLTLTRTL